MADPHAPPPRPLYKQNSWSPDILLEETWQRQKSNWGTRSLNRSKSISDDDLEELKACIELGFGFDSPEIDPKLCRTLPALESYHALNKQRFGKSVSTGGDDAEVVKMRLKQWAQLVACAVRESSSSGR
ncbi:hypothetical protein RchiOBHm_Chr6g0257581 [Rosa chinensis]|uniref:Uncharacterized protein n=1 Tax=Rosa chinensis TaxID=74649 RepID=A0A2P6PME3_ROSCH|nr:uncharacterized protein LOC112174825 [Rosa chinensis]PRQ23102.1 hypothetical protein RchiOBHm_Chr6g0257581 [Rosa chinensis]